MGSVPSNRLNRSAGVNRRRVPRKWGGRQATGDRQYADGLDHGVRPAVDVLVIQYAEHVHIRPQSCKPLDPSADHDRGSLRACRRTQDELPATSAHQVVEHVLQVGGVTLATCAGTILAAMLMRII